MSHHLFGVASALLVAGGLSAQDTIVVNVDRSPRWGPAPELIEELRLGKRDGREEDVFGRLVAAGIGPAGEVVVADQHGPAIQVFDAFGRYLHNIGRSGQGPGEYQQIAGLHVALTGEVSVWDPRNQRVTVFSLDGVPLRSIRMPASVLATGESFKVDAAGNFYVQVAHSYRGNTIRQLAWIRVSRSGEILDTLPIPATSGRDRPLEVIAPEGSLKPFTREVTAALSPYGYQVIGYTSDFALWYTLPGGRTVRLEGHRERARVLGQERDQWQALFNFMGSVSRSERAGFAPLPEFKPVFRGLWVDQSGRIWVHRYVPAVRIRSSQEQVPAQGTPPSLEWREPPVWDVVDRTGAFLGTVRLPFRTRPVAATGDLLWTIQQGELGEDYLVRYRIRPGW